jgi:hypothetical protein
MRYRTRKLRRLGGALLTLWALWIWGTQILPTLRQLFVPGYVAREYRASDLPGVLRGEKPRHAVVEGEGQPLDSPSR